MRKKILFIGVTILIFLIFSLAYLSIYGIKTDRFNSFINNKVKEYNSKLLIQIDEVYIKLNFSEGAINIHSKDALLIAESNPIKISNIDINLNLIKFLKNEKSIKNIKINSENNLIKDATSFLNSVNYDLFRYMFYSQVKNGLLNFELDIKFDNLNQNIVSYIIFGSVNNAIINLPGYDNIDDINFNFQAKNKKIKISELYFNYQGVDVKSEKIEAKEKSGVYYVSGDFENSKTLFNPNLAFKHLNIKHNLLSKKDILFKSKNKFSFRFNKNKKIKNFKLHSVINFDEIYFNEKYQNILFLKQGIINSKFDNEGLTADLKSNFVFSNDLNANKDFKNNKLELSFISQNINKIKIKGNISNKKKFLDPKIFLNLTNLSSNILSKKKINIQTDTNFRFEIINSKIENYLLNSEIYLDKLELNEQIQDILYFKNIKTKLSFGDKLFKINLKSNYSFFDKNLNKESDNNIINIDLDKNDSKISDIKFFVQSDNNYINIKKLKKYFKLQEQYSFIEDKIIKLNSNITVNASLDDKLNIKKITANSKLNLDDINIDYKSKLIKKYLSNYNNKLTIKNPQISFELLNQDINLQLDGKYLLKDKEDNLFIKFKGNKNNFEFYSLLDLNNSNLNFEEIQYSKIKDLPSQLEILISKSNNRLKIVNIDFIENKNFISAKNLNLSDNLKIQSIDEIDVNFLNYNGVKNNFKMKKNLNNYNIIGSHIDGEKLVEKLLKNNKQNKVSSLFDNINATIILDLEKIYLEKNEYLKKFKGEFDIKKNNLILAKANALLDNGNKFSYFYRTTPNNAKITNIFIQEPKPFINNYKFIKGFEEGELKLNSTKIDNTSRSNLKIINFKVKEVPILAKILTLASLQGMADLLTGEGIRFDEFEMDFKTRDNLTEIDEMYALGPAISIMMDGYIEKDRLTSLRGTLVPATTINKTISKIPLIGDILVGRKSGEGIFGVSFKIKGPPNDLKSTVNPIKTLTPRFITRTLENLKGN